MARTCSRSRKRKFCGNQHTQRSPKSAKIEKPIGENATIESASERKIKGKREVKEEKEEILGSSLTGYRLMDVEILADVLRLLCCQECGESNIQLTEVSFQRHGCASCLRLLCLCCGWNHCFYTSKKISKYYEVNRRLVYGMRTIGQGEASARRFCGIMNMPPPPKPKAYSRHNKALLKAAKAVANQTLNDAQKEIHHLKGEDVEGFSNCGVSCDGTWQKRGHSSLNLSLIHI